MLLRVAFGIFFAHCTIATAGTEFLKATPVEDFQGALERVKGCRGEDRTPEMRIDERLLEPMWRAAPKNKQGLVEWATVRYLIRRYFMRHASLLVRGFEPMQMNTSGVGIASLLSEGTPPDVQEMLYRARSFSYEEISSMISAIEHLIFEADRENIEEAFLRSGKSLRSTLDHEEFSEVMHDYMVAWLLGEDIEMREQVLEDPSHREIIIPKYNEIHNLIIGVIKTVRFEARKVSIPGTFTFADALHASHLITKRFSAFWENECVLIKESLTSLDKSGTGRVSLTDFYGANADGEWRFGESVAYLRELGALDESSTRVGTQVLIPNYVQAASNCISQTHYFVCCVNECEEKLAEIEAAVGAPFADPEQILEVAQNMTNFDDEPPHIHDVMRNQLRRIADLHGGQVPLYGRLLAQWLHYVFPHECPFPHKVGKHAAVTPLQFGDNYLVSEEEVEHHSAMRNENVSISVDIKELQQLSLWSNDGDDELDFPAPWESSFYPPWSVVMVLGMLMLLTMVAKGNARKGTLSAYSRESAVPSFITII